jgi:hypothetical protein
MLVHERFVKEETSNSGRSKHAFDKGFEFDIAVIELSWNGAMQLELIGLETLPEDFGQLIACISSARVVLTCTVLLLASLQAHLLRLPY